MKSMKNVLTASFGVMILSVGAALRPPAVPLVAVEPHFNVRN